jgi:hypothetical protein
MAKLLWWMVLYGVYWPMRLLYFELPRVAWRAWQRRQARREFTATAPPPFTTPRAVA